MHRQDLFDTFQFNHDFVIHDEINPIAAIQLDVLISNRDVDLLTKLNLSQL